jgi:hypothetical protein
MKLVENLTNTLTRRAGISTLPQDMQVPLGNAIREQVEILIPQIKAWLISDRVVKRVYDRLVETGMPPEEARGITYTVLTAISKEAEQDV